MAEGSCGSFVIYCRTWLLLDETIHRDSTSKIPASLAPDLNQIEISWRGSHASAVSYYHRPVDRVGELLSCELVGGLYHEIEIVGEDVETGDLG